MDTLFTEMENERKSEVAPLAVRMRPRTLEEVVGQDEAVGPGSWLRNAIEQDQLSSVILFGPAGTGKTSLAHVIAETTKATFVEVSAIGGTVSDLRREIDAATAPVGVRFAHHPVRRRDPPLQPQPAGRAAARRGRIACWCWWEPRTENPFFELTRR